MSEKTTNINIYATTIIENRYIGKVQLNADDLGGADCSTWAQYRKICDNVVFEAYNKVNGRGVDSDALGLSTTALFTFFGVSAKAITTYQMRLLACVIGRKAKRSDTLKDAISAKNKAKKVWEKAILDEKPETEIAELKTDYEEKSEIVNTLYKEPNNFWYELKPMLDKDNKHASASARKAIEDTIADIINERELMTIEELQAEAQALADLRKGRAIRKKNEKKAALKVEDKKTETVTK